MTKNANIKNSFSTLLVITAICMVAITYFQWQTYESININHDANAAKALIELEGRHIALVDMLSQENLTEERWFILEKEFIQVDYQLKNSNSEYYDNYIASFN